MNRQVDPGMTFEEACERWKNKTRDSYLAMIRLDAKAEDSGLTADEQIVYESHRAFTIDQLAWLLDATKDCPERQLKELANEPPSQPLT